MGANLFYAKLYVCLIKWVYRILNSIHGIQTEHDVIYMEIYPHFDTAKNFLKNTIPNPQLHLHTQYRTPIYNFYTAS